MKQSVTMPKMIGNTRKFSAWALCWSAIPK